MSKGTDPAIHFTDPKVIALCKATIDGDLAAIDQLVAKGVNVNARGKQGMTPLVFSMVGANKAGLRRLMQHGADPNLQKDNKRSFMFYAARADDVDYLEMGLRFGGDPDLRGPSQQTLLFETAQKNTSQAIKMLQILLDHGADINALSHPKGIHENAAMAAAGINQYESALFLLEKGINYKHANKAGYTIVRSLESNGIGYNPGYEGYDARTKVAQFLIDKGIEVQLNKPYEAPDDWLEKSFGAIGEPVPAHLSPN